MQIHLMVHNEPAQLTVTMSDKKAEEVSVTLKKAIEQGQEWLKTGVPPT
jgi:hypothetical protein